MKVAANQPYLFPYIGYWQLINSVDVFALCDNYQYIFSGWINRNRILVNGTPKYFRVELHDCHHKNMTEIMVKEVDLNAKYNQLYEAYKRAPYFEETWNLIKKILMYEDRTLSEYVGNSIRVMCDYLDIDTKIIRTSDFEGNDNFKGQDRILDLCKRLGADTYINAVGGQELYSYAVFRENGFELQFINPGLKEYKQFHNEFVPGLSIIDLLMFLPKEEVKAQLNNCTFIREVQS